MKTPNDDFMDALFKQLSHDYVASESKRLTELNNSLPDVEFSEQFQVKMEKLIRKTERRAKLRKIPTYAAAVSTAVVVVGVANPHTVNAIKATFTNLIQNTTDKYVSTVSFKSNVEYDTCQFPSDLNYLYVPSKLPSGYYVDKFSYKKDLFYKIDYKSNTSLITYEVWHIDSLSHNLDNERGEIKNVNLNLGKGLMYKKKNILHLSWQYDSYDFTLSSEGLDEEKLIEIANNITLTTNK